MKKPLRALPRAKKQKPARYRFRLFTAGKGQNSQIALANLRNLCREYLGEGAKIETVDVVGDFQAAVRNNILVTPALIMVEPRPAVTILGNLSDLPRVLVALRVTGGDS